MSKFINNAYFRKEVDVDNNIEDKVFDNPIKRAQETLRMILGETFYATIQTEFDAGTYDPSATSSHNKTLFDPYIKQYVAWQAYEFWLAKANFNYTRSGVRVHTDESSTVASEKSMGELLRDAKQSSQFYKGLLMSFLKNNEENYPDYDDCNRKTFGTGFHITSISRKNPTSGQIDRKKNNEY